MATLRGACRAAAFSCFASAEARSFAFRVAVTGLRPETWPSSMAAGCWDAVTGLVRSVGVPSPHRVFRLLRPVRGASHPYGSSCPGAVVCMGAKRCPPYPGGGRFRPRAFLHDTGAVAEPLRGRNPLSVLVCRGLSPMGPVPGCRRVRRPAGRAGVRLPGSLPEVVGRADRNDRSGGGRHRPLGRVAALFHDPGAARNVIDLKA